MKYYDKLVLTREWIVRSEMIPVDPTDQDNTLRRKVDWYGETWNNFYVLYEKDEQGDYHNIGSSFDFHKMSTTYIDMLYRMYVEEALGSSNKKRPKTFEEWKEEDLKKILDKKFPTIAH